LPGFGWQPPVANVLTGKAARFVFCHFVGSVLLRHGFASLSPSLHSRENGQHDKLAGYKKHLLKPLLYKVSNKKTGWIRTAAIPLSFAY
jgi:hypothetical protein